MWIWIVLVVLAVVVGLYLFFRNALYAATPCGACGQRKLRVWCADPSSKYIYFYCEKCNARYRKPGAGDWEDASEATYNRFYTQSARDHFLNAGK